MQAAQVKLVWAPNTEATLAGYKIHYGNTSRSYTIIKDLSSSISCSIGNLEPGKTYYFAATAYDINGVESDYSNEATYTVPAGNHPPVTQEGTLNVTEDQSASGTLRATDPEGETLTFKLVAIPAKGSVTLNNTSTGAFTYTPHPNMNGPDIFSFKVSDGILDSNTSTISVNISSINDPPRAIADQGAVTAGSSIAINVLSNDTDVDGDILSIASVTQGKNGHSIISGSSVQYTSTATFSGTDTFSYTVTDGRGGYSTASVTIQVLAANKAPTANNTSVSVKAGSTITGRLTATDPEGNALRYSLVSLPSKGNASVLDASTGSFSYTAHVGATGKDSFIFKANDGKADSNSATVSVSITGTSAVVFAVNAGGTQYVDQNGVTFAADTNFSGGWKSITPTAIAGTSEDALYQSQRAGNFKYSVPLANGHYLVTLKFAETYWSAAQKRVFDVILEGREVVSNIDLYAEAGKFTASDLRIPVRITDGMLDLAFNADVNYGTLGGFMVEKWDSNLTWGLNAGGLSYVDGTHMTYERDMLYSWGSVGNTLTQIVGTEDSILYQTERFGTFSYDIPVPNGVYQVTLKFAETYWSTKGKRVFDVVAEGEKVASSLDILAQSGGCTAYEYPITVTVTDGILNLKFTPLVGTAKLNAILIEAL